LIIQLGKREAQAMKKLLIIAGIILLVFGFKLGNDYLVQKQENILLSFDEPGQFPPITRARSIQPDGFPGRGRASFDEPGQFPPITRASFDEPGQFPPITRASFDEPGQFPPITRASFDEPGQFPPITRA
jgi:hypothetical protein